MSDPPESSATPPSSPSLSNSGFAQPRPQPALVRQWKALLSAVLALVAGLTIGLRVGLSAGACPSPFASLFPPRHSSSTLRARPVPLRVENRSSVDFRNVLVNGEPFGDIRAGASSPFHPMRHIHRYAAVNLDTPSGPLAITPIDFVGERELPEGLYTYVLTTNHGQLRIECVLTM